MQQDDQFGEWNSITKQTQQMKNLEWHDGNEKPSENLNQKKKEEDDKKVDLIGEWLKEKQQDKQQEEWEEYQETPQKRQGNVEKNPFEELESEWHEQPKKQQDERKDSLEESRPQEENILPKFDMKIALNEEQIKEMDSLWGEQAMIIDGNVTVSVSETKREQVIEIKEQEKQVQQYNEKEDMVWATGTTQNTQTKQQSRPIEQINNQDDFTNFITATQTTPPEGNKPSFPLDDEFGDYEQGQVLQSDSEVHLFIKGLPDYSSLLS